MRSTFLRELWESKQFQNGIHIEVCLPDEMKPDKFLYDDVVNDVVCSDCKKLVSIITMGPNVYYLVCPYCGYVCIGDLPQAMQDTFRFEIREDASHFYCRYVSDIAIQQGWFTDVFDEEGNCQRPTPVDIETEILNPDLEDQAKRAVLNDAHECLASLSIVEIVGEGQAKFTDEWWEVMTAVNKLLQTSSNSNQTTEYLCVALNRLTEPMEDTDNVIQHVVGALLVHWAEHTDKE